MVIDESKFPHLYALAYVIGHGEYKMPPLQLYGFTEAELQEMDKFLAQRTLLEVTSYAGPCEEVPQGWEEVHAYMREAGIAR